MSQACSQRCLAAIRIQLLRASKSTIPVRYIHIPRRSPLRTNLVRRSSSSSKINWNSPRSNESEFWELTGKKPSLATSSDGKSDLSRIIVGQNDLFHPLSQSPIPSMRKRAAFMTAHAYCSHPSHNRTRVATDAEDPESRKPLSGGLPPAHVSFECPYCGVPVSCSEEHWADDYEYHMNFCDTLRQVNEDDHDLRSGRQFPEFKYAEENYEEQVVNFTNWDTLLYTRGFEAVDAERSLRHVTRMLTYPVTIGSVLHELSPYSLRNGGRLTPEGLRSFSGKYLGSISCFATNFVALRYTLHPPLMPQGDTVKNLRPEPPPVRIFVLGARAESSLPREVWIQLAFLFHRVKFHLIMIGPESMMNRDDEFPLPERTARNPFGAVIEDSFSREMKISTYVEYYHTLHEARQFVPYDPYFDCFVLFHPGLGHPSSSHEWGKTVVQLLETKCSVIVTGYTQWDMQRDIDWMKKQVSGEMDILLEPGENRFRSLRWDLNDLDPHDVTAGNWGVWAFRGKRYEAERHKSED